ncbi:MAG: 2-oxoacid:acceptor oxidoreductase subunit alpha [Fidelibacterota bacterium]
MSNKSKPVVNVVIRFAGDSGDGMQLMGDRFTATTAMVGNDLGTFPDYPAEIRAPAGSLAGVSAFQIQFSSQDIFTPGDWVDVLVAMNPAALKMHIQDLRPGGTLIANKSNFQPKNLKLAGYKSDPLTDSSLSGYKVLDIEITGLVFKALEDMRLPSKTVERTKNMFALGLTFWMYGRPLEPTIKWLGIKFKKRPELVEANVRALKAGFHFGDISEVFPDSYRVAPAPMAKGTYRNITGNHALGLGLLTAAEKSGLPLFFGGYPITPASEILHQLSLYRNFGVRTFQAEDEIASIGASIGAAFAGSLAVTASSGPGIALKSEAMGLAVITELPLVIINIQRAGPSTGMPTKTEQGDLFQVIFGRNGESPIPVISAISPSDCFYVAYEACRVALKYMTPIIVLSDAYLASGSEPWLLPNLSELDSIEVEFARSDNNSFHPYLRNNKTLARPWAIPGTPGLEHRIGGLEKEDFTGNVSYDPENHQKMVELREAKISGITREMTPTELYGDTTGDLLILGWGSTYGSIRTAVKRLQEEGKSVSHAHVRWVNPLPLDLGEMVLRYQQVLIPELNRGQFLKLIRAEYLVDAKGMNVIRGKPIRAYRIEDAANEMLESSR